MRALVFQEVDSVLQLFFIVEVDFVLEGGGQALNHILLVVEGGKTKVHGVVQKVVESVIETLVEFELLLEDKQNVRPLLVLYFLIVALLEQLLHVCHQILIECKTYWHPQ